MLKNIDKYEASSHFTYDDYKKKVKKAPNNDIMIFASVFVIGLLIILGFAKILSPNVDVAISKEGETISTEEENLMRVVDDRLRMLKLEDEGRIVDDSEMFSPELDELVILPDFSKRKTKEIKTEETTEPEHPSEQSKTDKPKEQVQQPEPKEQKTVTQPTQTVTARVVVGYYATEKQAEVAKSIIQDAGLDVTPVVRNLGGYYTLQVGSYSSKERAQQAANNLLKSNFPARVIVD